MSSRKTEQPEDPNLDNGALGNNLAEGMMGGFTLRSPEGMAQQMQCAQEYFARQEQNQEKAQEDKDKRPNADKTM